MEIKNLEFIHITKTAGTSIEDWGYKNNILWSYRKRHHFENRKQHYLHRGGSWHEPPRFFLDNPYKNKKTFTCVRNPYIRLISEYYCPWTGSKNTQKHCKKEFNQWIINLINKDNVVSGIPQYLYMPTDFIIKFESLQEDFTKLIHSFDSSLNTTLPHNNKSKYKLKKFSVNDLDKKTIQIINAKYEKDFNLFDYKMIPV